MFYFDFTKYVVSYYCSQTFKSMLSSIFTDIDPIICGLNAVTHNLSQWVITILYKQQSGKGWMRLAVQNCQRER